MKIVIVDDNKIELREVQNIISSMEAEIEIAGCFYNGGDAYEFIKKNDVDIVISDVQMPVMDGLELCSALYKDAKDVAVILLSCFDDFTFVKGGFQKGAFNYILKPIIPQELVQSVESAWAKLLKSRSIAAARKKMGDEIDTLRPMMLESFFRSQLYGMSKKKVGLQELKLLGIDKKLQYKAVIKARIMMPHNIEASTVLDYASGVHSCFRAEIESLSDAEKSFYSIESGEDEVTVVMLSGSTDIPLAEMMSDFKFNLMNHLGIYASFGISDIREEDWRLLNQQAEKALEYTFNSCSNYVIQYDDIKNELENDIDVKMIAGSVKRIIANGDEAQIMPFILECLSDNKYFNDKYAKNMAYCIAYSVEMALLEYDKSVNKELGNGLWTKLSRFDSIVSLKEWLGNILLAAVEIVHEKNEREDNMDGKTILVDKIKDIVRKEYGEKLTIAQIAAKLGYSTRYISKIFTEKEKQSILDYLTQYRMEKAKEFLLEKDAKIYYVAERVGYVRKSYFYDVFKTYTGMSPSDFQKAYCVKDSERLSI